MNGDLKVSSSSGLMPVIEPSLNALALLDMRLLAGEPDMLM
jgi:hypothetical protein